MNHNVTNQIKTTKADKKYQILSFFEELIGQDWKSRMKINNYLYWYFSMSNTEGKMTII